MNQVSEQSVPISVAASNSSAQSKYRKNLNLGSCSNMYDLLESKPLMKNTDKHVGNSHLRVAESLHSKKHRPKGFLWRIDVRIISRNQ